MLSTLWTTSPRTERVWKMNYFGQKMGHNLERWWAGHPTKNIIGVLPRIWYYDQEILMLQLMIFYILLTSLPYNVWFGKENFDADHTWINLAGRVHFIWHDRSVLTRLLNTETRSNDKLLWFDWCLLIHQGMLKLNILWYFSDYECPFCNINKTWNKSWAHG